MLRMKSKHLAFVYCKYLLYFVLLYFRKEQPICHEKCSVEETEAYSILYGSGVESAKQGG